LAATIGITATGRRTVIARLALRLTFLALVVLDIFA